MIHPNSTEAYHATAPLRSNRTEQILEVFRSSSVALTDRQVAEKLGKSDMNSVRPRITELIENRLLVETGFTQCPVTLRRVRVVTAPALPGFLDFQ